MRRPLLITVTVPGAPTGATDELGNPIVSANVVSTATVKAFAPRASVESAEDAGAFIVSGGTVYGYTGTAFPVDAILTINGDRWQVEGEIGDWNPAYTSGINLGTDGIEFAVSRMT